MDLLVLMFVTGFALATLVFWPLLNRANRRLAESGLAEPATAPKGRHALRTPAAPVKPAPPTVIPRRPSTDDQPPATEPEAETETWSDAETRSEAEPEAPRSAPVAPQQRSAEPAEIPQLPTDLFEKHFEAKFNRSRQRLARIRDEISKE
ncbi:hypothetical protein [Saccharopolyspora spinosa]|uniref:Uncharacterized protein n=1 Tax=Saccharopolyspora spinosa TaxID=60894 RepID=A0A2N3XVP0_SACSN|nr:hypothetical protein [Saccharopolyspora spinosa]PKW14736.1 hypothetical protein A8926_2380 [Saccharopolyspora spinosa]